MERARGQQVTIDELPPQVVQEAAALWPERGRAAKRCGLTAAQFRGQERIGAFRFLDLPDGRRVFDPKALVEWMLARPQPHLRIRMSQAGRAVPGDVAAEAFRMFAAHASKADVVMRLSLNPHAVDDLREHFQDGGTAHVLDRATIEELRDMVGWDGATNESLTAAVRGKIRDVIAEATSATNQEGAEA